jgi:type IV pilus assembly protein PilV
MRSQSGFTMLEVLISMVIIAFGLLGVAGLQVFALKNNQSATFRSTATMLAADMADRIKANVGGAIDGAYNAPSLAAYGTAVAGCAGAGCTTAELAQNDLFEWQQRIAVALPAGVGIVCLDSTPHDGAISTAPECDNTGETNYVIKIWWADDRTRSGNVATPQRFSTAFNR